MTKSKTNEELKAEFVDAAILHKTAEANAAGNKQAIRASKKMHSIYQELKTRPDGLNVFLELLHHPDVRVQIWAGPFGLTHFPNIFEARLMEIAQGPEARPKWDAEALLQAWKDGMPLA